MVESIWICLNCGNIELGEMSMEGILQLYFEAERMHDEEVK